MRLTIGKTKELYLHDAHVESIFINEYLPQAPGDFVKVYLYARMYAEFGLPMDDRTMESELGITSDRVREAWSYWQKMGAVRLVYGKAADLEPTIEFVDLKEQMLGTSGQAANPGRAADSGQDGAGVPAPREEQAAAREALAGLPLGQRPVQPIDDPDLRNMFLDMEQLLSRSLSSSEIRDILGWVQEERIPPELVLQGLTYCLEKGKTSLKYLSRVVHGWAEEGLSTVDQVRDHLAEVDQRHYQYRRVLKALGFARNATEQEQKMMDRWFDEMGCDMDRVLQAVAKTAGISSPNFNYVNKVLENWKTEADKRGGDVNDQTPVTTSVLNRYYKYLREQSRAQADERTQEVYRKLPRIREIDQEVQSEGAALSRELLRGNDKRKSRKIRAAMDQLQEERAVLLTDHDFPLDYTDMRYKCEKCKDTGITDLGARCTCVPDRMREAAVWVKEEEGRKG